MPQITMSLQGTTLDVTRLELELSVDDALGSATAVAVHNPEDADAVEAHHSDRDILLVLTREDGSTVTWGPWRGVGDLSLNATRTETTFNLVEQLPDLDPAPVIPEGQTVAQILALLWPELDLTPVPGVLLGARVEQLETEGKERAEIFQALLGVIGYRLAHTGPVLSIIPPARENLIFADEGETEDGDPIVAFGGRTRAAAEVPERIVIQGAASPALPQSSDISGPALAASVDGGVVHLSWNAPQGTAGGIFRGWTVMRSGAEVETLSVDVTALEDQPGDGEHVYTVVPQVRVGQSDAFRIVAGQPGPEARVVVGGALGTVTATARPGVITVTLPVGGPETRVTATGPTGSASTITADSAEVGTGKAVDLPLQVGDTVQLTFEYPAGGVSYPPLNVTVPEQVLSNLQAAPGGKSALISWATPQSHTAVRISGDGGMPFEGLASGTALTVYGLRLGTSYTARAWPVGAPEDALEVQFTTANEDLDLSPEEVFELSNDATYTTVDTVQDSEQGTTTITHTLVKAGGRLTQETQRTVTSLPITTTDGETGDQFTVQTGVTEVSNTVHEYRYPAWPLVTTGSTTVARHTEAGPGSPIATETRTRTDKVLHPRGWVNRLTVVTDTEETRHGVPLVSDRQIDTTSWKRTGVGTWGSSQAITGTDAVAITGSDGAVTGYRSVARSRSLSSASAQPPEMVPEPQDLAAPLDLGEKGPAPSPAWEVAPLEDGEEGTQVEGEGPMLPVSVTRATPYSGPALDINLGWTSDLAVLNAAADLAVLAFGRPRYTETNTYYLPVGARLAGAVQSVQVTADLESDTPYSETVVTRWAP